MIHVFNLTLPKDFAPQTDMRVDLSGSQYILAWKWNVRAGRWFLDICDEAGNALRAGIQVDVSMPWRAPGIPGALMLVDTTGAGEAPGFDNIGARFLLGYYTAQAS